MDAFIDSQVLLPDAWKPIDASEIVGTSPKAKLLRRCWRSWKSARKQSDPPTLKPIQNFRPSRDLSETVGSFFQIARTPCFGAPHAMRKNASILP